MTLLFVGYGLPPGIAGFHLGLRASTWDCGLPPGIAGFRLGLRASAWDCGLPPGIAGFRLGLQAFRGASTGDCGGGRGIAGLNQSILRRVRGWSAGRIFLLASTLLLVGLCPAAFAKSGVVPDWVRTPAAEALACLAARDQGRGAARRAYLYGCTGWSRG
jgi:hypothetical protein